MVPRGLVSEPWPLVSLADAQTTFSRLERKIVHGWLFRRALWRSHSTQSVRTPFVYVIVLLRIMLRIIRYTDLHSYHTYLPWFSRSFIGVSRADSPNQFCPINTNAPNEDQFPLWSAISWQNNTLSIRQCARHFRNVSAESSNSIHQ
jgi:hypothetical protein